MLQDINLNGFAKYFRNESAEELKHANEFIDKLLERNTPLKMDQVELVKNVISSI